MERVRLRGLFWVGLAFGALLLAFSLRGTTLAEQWGHLGALRSAGWILLVLLVFEWGLIALRALRWRVLFAAPRPGYPLILVGVGVGYFYNNLVPRSGELARTVLVGRTRRGGGVAATLSTVVVERLIDVIALGGLALVALAVSPLAEALIGSRRGARAALAGAALVGVLGLIGAAYFAPAISARWAAPLVSSVGGGRRERAQRWVGGQLVGLLSGLDGLRGLARAELALVVAVTATLTFGGALPGQWLAAAFGRPIDYPTALFIFTAIVIGKLFPSGPANAGSMVAFASWSAERTAIADAAPAYAATWFGALILARALGGAVCLLLAARLGGPEAPADD